MLLLCFEGKKVSQPTVPCLLGRNIQVNGDLDASGVYWIQCAGSLHRPEFSDISGTFIEMLALNLNAN